jgi:hypothetical protein
LSRRCTIETIRGFESKACYLSRVRSNSFYLELMKVSLIISPHAVFEATLSKHLQQIVMCINFISKIYTWRTEITCLPTNTSDIIKQLAVITSSDIH